MRRAWAGPFAMKHAPVPRLLIVVAAMLAIGLLSVSLRDVPRNHMIRDPQPSIKIIWICIALTVPTCAWACLRPSRLSSYSALAASAVGILWSLMLACV